MMKFTPRNEKTRQFIIETTAEVFNKKGYAGTSLNDLTEATKLTKGSIYGNFENKEEVALAVFEYNIMQRNRELASAVAASCTCREKLLVYATFFASGSARNPFPKGGCPYLNTGIEADDTNETMRRKVADALMGWKKRISDIVEQGIASGEFKPDTAVGTVAIMLIALAEGAIFMSSVTKSNTYVSTVAAEAAKLIEAIVA